jgi:hypothetical protein
LAPAVSLFILFVSLFVPEVEIDSKRSPISDDRRDRRKFTAGPMCCPAKRIPGCVAKLEKTLEAVYRQWRRVIERNTSH